MMVHYPIQLDEIDQWLVDNFDIIPGACSSTENLRYNTAKMIAEALWQKEQDHDACYQCEKAYDNVFFKGEQHAIKMLKAEALTGEIMETPWGALVAKTIQGIDEGKFKFGDKVKVIILKDE